MDININAVGFTADQKLLDYIEKKADKLQRFGRKLLAADFFLKLENAGQVKDKIVEIRINVPNSTLVASETSKSFEISTDAAIDSMIRQIKKRKEKLIGRNSR